MNKTILLRNVVAVILVFVCVHQGFTLDKIETVDGTVFIGKIVREDQQSLFVEIQSGTIAILKSKISNIFFEEKWDIEDHVTRVPRADDENGGNFLPEAESSECVQVTYFPFHEGNWWKYAVTYKPESLYGGQLPDKRAGYNVTWRLSAMSDTKKQALYFAQYKKKSDDVYVLSMEKSGGEGSVHNKIVFLGAVGDDEIKTYVVMTDDNVAHDYIYYQRLVPLNPFRRKNKSWVDVGQEDGTMFNSRHTILGVEGITTSSGYFDDCVLIERIDEIENQTLKTRTYLWFAPHVGLVKMVQEIIYPQVESGALVKSFIFQEYDLVDYEVKHYE